MDDTTVKTSDDMSADPSALDREAYDWVKRFASGNASRGDLAALKQWSASDPGRAEAFDRVSRTWKTLGPLGEQLSADSASRSASQPAGSPAASARMGRRAMLGGALAASAAGIMVTAARPPLGLWPSWSELAADYRTTTGEQRRITLPDNNSIEMNTQTSIALRSNGEPSDRIELIAGEAIVLASPGNSPATSRPFTMLAADGRIVASDSRFNVRFQDRTVCVTCLAGQLRIERQATVLLLGAGQQVFYSRAGIGPATPVDPVVVAAWQDGIVIFQSTPVKNVIAEVNRYRSGRIILTSDVLGERLFNARLRIATIDRVVGQIEQAFGAHATTLPAGIVLLG